MSIFNHIYAAEIDVVGDSEHAGLNACRIVELTKDESNQIARECLAFIGIARFRESSVLCQRTLSRLPTFVFDEARELFSIAINKVNENHPNHYTFRDRLTRVFGPLDQVIDARIGHCLIEIVPYAAKQ